MAIVWLGRRFMVLQFQCRLNPSQWCSVMVLWVVNTGSRVLGLTLSTRLSVCLQDKIDAAGLPRTVRFLFCVAAVAALWLTTSYTQSAIGFFVACTYWRTLLAPREVSMKRAWGAGGGGGAFGGSHFGTSLPGAVGFVHLATLVLLQHKLPNLRHAVWQLLTGRSATALHPLPVGWHPASAKVLHGCWCKASIHECCHAAPDKTTSTPLALQLSNVLLLC